MSATSAPDTAPAPAESPGLPPARRGLGSVRSMVISMIVIVAAVLAWVAMVPRVREIRQPAVEVSSVAEAARRETGWAISVPQVPVGWKATNVRFQSAADEARTWHAGYLSPDGDYVSIDQTAVTGATDSWLSARTSNGQVEGTIDAAGTTWQEVSSRQLLQRSLVSRPRVSKATGARELATVLSGTATYAELARFAEMLQPVPAS